MREIVLDTETTGLDPESGHRIIEIGCVELLHHVPTGRHFHQYLNPERAVEEEAFAVHGLSDEFLAGHPRFAEVADTLLEFLGEDPLVIHNARFDIGFLNAELRRERRSPIPFERAVDTVTIARRKYPGAQASLDALCRRFEIDLSGRALHGALLDAHLLAAVYLELVGGRQPGLAFAEETAMAVVEAAMEPRRARPIRLHEPSIEELAAHAAFVATLKAPLWSE